jgi:thioredoxin-dependent peroxiredoxin
MMNVGGQLPEFSLQTDEGVALASTDLLGRWVVLFFYPRDDTPGCTKEACGFRDAVPRFDASQAMVLGVSRDSVASHARFRARHGLTFPLLADVDGSLCEAFGVLKGNRLVRLTPLGIRRCTFLIDPSGRVARVWPTVHPVGHAEEVARALDELRGH